MSVVRQALAGLALICGLSACQLAQEGEVAEGSRPVATVGTTALLTERGITLPAGFTLEVVVDGLRGPTQMISGPDGRLRVAQLNGPENAGTGQIVAVDMTDGAQEVLLTGLTKPTGMAVLGDDLWIAAGPDILRASLDERRRPGQPEAILIDLPTNGSSNGTLTVTPDGQLLYETSGRRQASGVVEGSGILWRLDPADPANPVPLATGLKGAYAHAYDSAGRLWSTEISDDLVNGQAPPDEINLIVPGGDYGWPSCSGMGEPAIAYGGSAELCAMTMRPIALLPRHATPTSLIESPWEPGVLLVALWVSGEVVRIDPAQAMETIAAPATVFIGGLNQPQHLLRTEAGDLLLSDHGTGTIYRLQAARP